MTLLTYPINFMLPVQAGGFTIDATLIILLGTLIVAGYTTLAIKRSIINTSELSVTASTLTDNLDVDSVKQDTTKIDTGFTLKRGTSDNIMNDVASTSTDNINPNSENTLEEDFYKNEDNTMKT